MAVQPMDSFTTQGKLISAIIENYSEGLKNLNEKFNEAACNLKLGVIVIVSEDESMTDVGENARDLLRNHHGAACFYFRYVGYDVEDYYNDLGEVDGYVISWNNEKGR